MLTASLGGHVITFILICQLWAVVANHERVMRQEANPEIHNHVDSNGVPFSDLVQGELDRMNNQPETAE